jgi:carboxymethylenebutenolidase
MCLDDMCDDKNGSTDRRSFLAGATAAVTGILPWQEQANPQAKPPETRVLDDPAIQHGRIVFTHNGKETIDGYLARPKKEGVYPAVLVIAGNRITEEYIPNTCAALALAGYVGLAPNIFHPLTDDARTPQEIERALVNHTPEEKLQDVQVGADYLRSTTFIRPGGMGVLGFCSGGRLAMLYGARNREIDAVVAFHPAPMNQPELARLKAPVLVHHGTADHSVDVKNTHDLEKMLKAQKTPVEVFIYEGADHGFLAYTRPYYRPDYAKLAWKRTLQFLSRHLK